MDIPRPMTKLPSAPAAERHYWVFQLLFMIGFLFHSAEEWDVPYEVFTTIGLIGAFLAVDRLRDWVFLAFVSLLALRNIDKFPGLANHSNIILFVCLFLIPLQLRRCLKEDAETQTNETVATLRWVVLVMYFFTGFHKLNEDFFDPTVTCAFDKMEDYLSLFRLQVEDLPMWMQGIVPASVVVMELVPPVLFLFRRTQKFGIAMILLIHALLAPVGFADFSSLGMSLLWLYVSADALNAMPNRRYFSAMAIAFIAMQLLFAIWRIPTRDEVYNDIEGAILVLAFVPVWFMYFRANVPGPAMHWPRPWLHRAFLVFMVFFAMNNYLGLRTAGTMSMFSNLVTEGERSNHFLLGSNPIKVFGFQEDIVELVYIDPRIIGRYRRTLYRRNRVPRVEFDAILDRLRRRNFNQLRMAVRYDGKLYKTQDLVNDTTFDFSVPWWQKKVFKFRVIQPRRPQKCAW